MLEISETLQWGVNLENLSKIEVNLEFKSDTANKKRKDDINALIVNLFICKHVLNFLVSWWENQDFSIASELRADVCKYRPEAGNIKIMKITKNIL